MLMSDFPLKEQECRKDGLRCLQKLLNMLEEHIDALHERPESSNMKPGECEQALDRHIVLTLRLLQMRQQFAEAEQKADGQQALDEMFAGDGETRMLC
jgi:hypothetical protein